MQDNYESMDMQDPVQEAKDIAKRNWSRRAYTCQRSGTYHDMIPIAWDLTAKSKTVTILMCKRCFDHVNIEEAFEHRN